ncbi:AraC family transcriptional regulator [Hungatella hathewayi]
MLNNEEKINVDIMQDASEIVRYDETGIPLYIQTGELSRYPDRKALCHWHDDLEFIRIVHGEMNYYINGKNLVLKEHDGIMVNTRQMHYGSSINQNDCSFLCILVHPALFSSNRLIYQKYLLPLLEDRETEFVYLDSGRPDHGFILDCLMEMTQLKEHGEYGYELEIIGLFYLIWRHLARQFKAGKTAAPGSEDMDTKVQKDMVSFIYQHYTEKLTLSAIAASGGVCRSKCCQIFKKYLCQSPIDFLNSYRLEVSSHLLKKTDKSITEIATECGFNHLSYYSELFMRHYGCTPRQFRSQHPADS